MAVGAGGALTGGVNRLPPEGLIDFSVGDTEGAGDDDGAVVVVVVVVVVDVSGAFSELPPHAAVRPTIATMAAPPAHAATRRARRCDLMMLVPYQSPSSQRMVFGESPGDSARPAELDACTSPIPKWVPVPEL